ncbi:MAG: FtsX-like permease family protein [Acidobacteria bacterium]|nr:FtsX-like permease family protein [Acidobacteriota bacterium]
MRALDRKLFRDLWQLKGQVFAISCVLAAGIATYVMAASTLDSLQRTQIMLYAEYRFPHLFSGLKRAPESVAGRVAAIPGVVEVEPRIVAPANIFLASFDQPVSGQIVSLPRGEAQFNRLRLRTGRLPEPGRDSEVAVSDGFAVAHKLTPDFPMEVTINGRRKRVMVVGVVSTPEFIYQLAPGSIVPDFKTYCVLWMNRDALEGAYNMTGAFNEVAASLEPGKRVEDAIDALDHILRPYGGLGAYGRKDQVSHRYLSEEFKQLTVMSTMFPAIFLSVAAFLLNVVIGRLMATQRGQIAILKAFGYTTAQMAVHFVKLTLVIVVTGYAMGLALGAWLGSGLSSLYMDVYKFPYLHYAIRGEVYLVSALVGIAAGLTGTLFAVFKSAAESPAVAMQPAPPASYRVSIVEALGLGRWLSQPTRMIFRNIERRPVKSALSVLGVALSTSILILGGFWGDAVDYMVFAQLRRAQIEDVSVTFIGPVSERALYSMMSLPGVTHAEPVRTVPARLRFEQRTYRAAIQGIEDKGYLRRLLDTQLGEVPVPGEGVLLTDHLAKMLGIRVGDLLTVELLDGSRAVRQVPLTGVVSEFIGVTGYMRRDALNRFMREGSAITGAYLAANAREVDSLYAKLKAMPAVAGSASRLRVLESFYETLAAQMLTFALFNTLLAATIAVGVVYNTVRIALSERGRELASLRVLGYTRGEVTYILLGELAVLIFAAIPLGLLMGRGLAGVMAGTAQTELFRVPVVVEPSTYGYAALTIVVATLLSAATVARQIRKLDLVEVLKARE